MVPNVPPPVGHKYSTPAYTVRRGLFHWQVQRHWFYYADDEREVVLRTFSKDKATAHLVSLGLKGEKIEL